MVILAIHMVGVLLFLVGVFANNSRDVDNYTESITIGMDNPYSHQWGRRRSLSSYKTDNKQTGRQKEKVIRQITCMSGRPLVENCSFYNIFLPDPGRIMF